MSNISRKLGHISKVEFGIGGYNEGEIGLSVTLSGPDENLWGCISTKMAWDYCRVKHAHYCKWTEEERGDQYVEIVRYISTLLKDAKVNSLSELKGKPIEATFEGMMLVDWRVLTEVL